MEERIVHYLTSRDGFDLARDALDLLITYYIFYRVALVLRGTRAIQVVFGVALVFVLYLVSQLLQLTTVLTLLSAVLSSAILIGVVVFQNDIRRGLMRVGSRARFGSGQSLESKVIENVVEAATALARHRTGAIVTFEQDANLDEFVGSNTGHVVDAAVSKELLISLFIPEAMNQLHDGAVVIRDLRIAKAGVFFPMPDSGVSDDSFGSRHRAALGITQETDAVVVVVSEERGSISFCFNGNIIPNLDGPKLKAALEGVFVPKRGRSASSGRWARWFKRPEPKEQKPLEARRDRSSAPASEAKPVTEQKPLRSKKDAEVDSAPAPLRKKKSLEGDTRSDSTPPEPLRKRKPDGPDSKRSGDSVPPEPLRKRKADAPDSKRSDSTPPAPLRKRKPDATDGLRASTPPPGEALKTPLRHLAPPGNEDTGPISLRAPARLMPTAEDKAPDLPSTSSSEDDTPPPSSRHGVSRPMPRAGDVGAPGKGGDAP